MIVAPPREKLEFCLFLVLDQIFAHFHSLLVDCPQSGRCWFFPMWEKLSHRTSTVVVVGMFIAGVSTEVIFESHHGRKVEIALELDCCGTGYQ